MAADEDLARITPDPDGNPGPPPLTEFSPEVQALAALHDLIAELVRVQVAAVTEKKPPRIAPYPRPVTAATKERQRRRYAKHVALRDRLLPPNRN